MQPKDLFRLPESKYRLWTTLSSLGLGITGILLCFSITAAFFDLGTFLSLPGSFFVRSYGFLAFLIPAYFLYAAFILADPNYRPDRIFILGGLVFPFFTMALGFYWIREFETLKETSDFISRAGKTGLGFLVFFLSGLEILIVIFLRRLFFRGKYIPSAKIETVTTVPQEIVFGKPELNDNAAMRGNNDFSASPAEPKTKNQSLKDIYTKAAASMLVEPENPAVNWPKTAEPAPEIYQKKQIKPSGIIQNEPESKTALNKSRDEFQDKLHDEIIPVLAEEETVAETLEKSTEETDEDVAKALAKAEALAAQETARHGDKKDDSTGKKLSGRRKGGRPYFVPVEGILKQYPDGEYWIIDDDTRNAAVTLKETFNEFNIQVEVTGIRKGPVITMFEILPAPGIRLAKIENLADNIALRLAAQSVRIVAPIPGKHAVGIEVPNLKRNIVSFREIIEGELSRDGKKAEVPVVLGKDITGEAVTVDLVQMPHLLIAGATGSGKSVCVNSMILTLLYQKSPAECRLILIDPKIVELKLYNDIPHLLTPVITEPKKAFQALQYCICEMERRYACLDSMGVRDIRSYNKRIKERGIAAEFMPYIVVVIDEFADLMATTGKELESTVARLAAMSRAVGIHLVLATQRPSIDVITGLIKANIPSRIAFMVASKMDSRIIIDMVGAEKLLGKGDMLYAGAVDPFPIRMQGAFVSEEEVERVVDYVKSLGEPDYIDEEIFFDDEEEDANLSLFSDGEDPLYEKALEIVLQQGKASASYIQRRLKVGYNRAARLVEEMESHGVVGPAQGSKPREVLRGSAFN